MDQNASGQAGIWRVVLKSLRWATIVGILGGGMLTVAVLVRHPYEFLQAAHPQFVAFNLLSTSFACSWLIILPVMLVESLLGTFWPKLALKIRLVRWIPTVGLLCILAPVVLGAMAFGIWNGQANLLVAACIAFALILLLIVSYLVSLRVDRAMSNWRGSNLAYAVISVLLLTGYLAPFVMDSLLDAREQCADLPVDSMLSRPARVAQDLEGNRYDVVVYLTIDTLRADHLGCFGYPRNTSPTIDRLAGEGLLAQHMVPAASGTVPSFGPMMTGYPPWMIQVTHQASSVDDDLVTVAEMFQSNGYRTVGVSTNAFLTKDNGWAQGFDEFEFVGLIPAPEALEVMKTLVAKEDRYPLFIWLHFIDPHTSYKAPAENWTAYLEDSLYKDNQLGTVDYGSYGGVNEDRVLGDTWAGGDNETSDLREGYVDARYDGEIRMADHGVRLLLDFLREMGKSESLAIVLTSDHGETLYRGPDEFVYQHALDVYESAVHVPAIVWRSDSTEVARVAGIRTHLDLVPTLLEIGGIDNASDNSPGFGRSLFQKDPPDEWAITQTAWWDGLSLRMLPQAKRSPSYALIQGDYKLITYPHTDLLQVRDPLSLFHIRRMIWIKQWREDALYDIRSDPNERINLIERETDLATLMRRQLHCLVECEKASALVTEDEEEIDEHMKQRLRGLGYID